MKRIYCFRIVRAAQAPDTRPYAISSQPGTYADIKLLKSRP